MLAITYTMENKAVFRIIRKAALFFIFNYRLTVLDTIYKQQEVIERRTF